MAAQPPTLPQSGINFAVRAEGYAVLTIEELILGGAGNALLPPPLRTPAVNQTLGRPGGTLSGDQETGVHSRPWNVWFMDVYRALMGSNRTIRIIAPSVDETDINWYGTGTIDGGTDPVTFAATLVGDPRAGTGANDARGLQLTITDPGTGYGSPPTFTVVGSGPVGTAQPGSGTTTISGGKVTSMVLSHNGYNLVPPLTVVFSAGNAKASASLGRQWAVGDYIIWNDDTIINRMRAYEIDQITKIIPVDDTHATFTLARGGPTSTMGQAQYGSLINPHTTRAFYRLINKTWNITPFASSLGPQVLKLPWDNMLVTAVNLSFPAGQNGTTINLAPPPYVPGTTNLDPRAFPPCPGLRTMSGAEYINLKGTGVLTVGQTADNRVSVTAAWESVRCIAGTLRTAVSGVNLIVDVMYISPDLTQVGLIDEIVITAGNKQSYVPSTNGLDGRQMPYHNGATPWPSPNAGATDWPPEVLPKLSGALDGNGNLVNGWAVIGGAHVVWQPGGYIDFIVQQTDGTAADLTVAVQT